MAEAVTQQTPLKVGDLCLIIHNDCSPELQPIAYAYFKVGTEVEVLTIDFQNEHPYIVRNRDNQCTRCKRPALMKITPPKAPSEEEFDEYIKNYC